MKDRIEWVLSLLASNWLEPKKEIRKGIKIGSLKIQFSWRSKSNLWGRFGGGWNWKLGLMAGGGTLIVSVFVFDLRFDIEKKKPRQV